MQNTHEILTAGEIAERLFGTNTHTTRKRVYRLEGDGLPVFRLGGALVSRKARLDEYIEAQEAAALQAA